VKTKGNTLEFVDTRETAQPTTWISETGTEPVPRLPGFNFEFGEPFTYPYCFKEQILTDEFSWKYDPSFVIS
jgi:hypothetical protein